MSAPTPFEISDAYVDEVARLDPVWGTRLGVADVAHRWGDQSPDGRDAKRDLMVRTRDAFAAHLDHPDPKQRHAARVSHDDLDRQVASYEASEHLYDLNNIASTFQYLRGVFDLMDPTTADGRSAMITRLRTLDEPLAGYRQTLALGLDTGHVVAKRQARAVAEQARALAGDDSSLRVHVERIVEADPAVADDAAAALEAASAAVSDFGEWLETVYLPQAPDVDAVGPERYARCLGLQLGMDADPVEAYQWGWHEIERLLAEGRHVAAQISPGSSRGEVVELLENDPARAATSVESFLEFIDRRQAEAVDALDGVHFEVDPRIREVSVNLAPPGSALGAYYVDPSEDFERPGSIWYSFERPGPVPLYQEIATAYHEGFPGHHMQVASTLALGDELCRGQRAVIWNPGHGEGWGLYAERLMLELGFYEKPDYHFGMICSQLFRAARVVADIGLHLQLSIPDAAPGGPGSWTFERAVEFMSTVGIQPRAYAVSDVTRYLGWPGQAPSYKLGERVILDIRDRRKQADGPAFDLRAFHTELLGAGNMGLDMLTTIMSPA